MRESIKKKLLTLFLYTSFFDIQFLKGEIAKHFEIPESSISLTHKETVKNGDGNIELILLNLKIYEFDFVVRFLPRVQQPKEIEVPKVVKVEKKWWQINVPDTKVVIEKQMSSEKPTEYWVLTDIQ